MQPTPDNATPQTTEPENAVPENATPSPTQAAPAREAPAPSGSSPQPGEAPAAPPAPVKELSSLAADAPKPAGSVVLSAEVNAEIDAAMAQLDAEAKQEADKRALEASAKPAAIRGPRVVQAGREHRTGKVVSVGPNDVFIEFGPKELGVVDRKQFADDALPEVGSELKLVVNRYDREESIFVCSLPGTVQKADWEMLEPGQTLEARVTGVNKGGLELEVAGHRAFMPASQVALGHIDDLSVFVGDKMTCQVQRVDRGGKGNIVLSRRNILQEERAKQAEELKTKLEVGQTVEGVVRKIMPFGAFVDLGGVDGLVHISDIAHTRIPQGEKHIAEHIQEGQRVRVQILKISWEDNRISLGMKQLQEDPFVTASNEIQEGADVSGRVKNIADFGVFVEIAPGIEGLIHISELDYKRVGHPSEVVKADEVITVRVLKVDPESHKISLSLKALKDAPKGSGGKPGGGGKGGRGRGGRGDRDTRSPEEILKESPEFRRLREQAKQKKKQAPASGGGLGTFGGLGEGLGGLKL